MNAPASAGEVAAPARDLVVVGASSGGVAALRTLVAGLPADFAGVLFVVMHLGPGRKSVLHEILARAGPLPALSARDGMAIEPGRILVAPPDHHLLVERDRVSVVHGPKENRHRPAIDPLFRSAAWAYGPRVVGVVLTGQLDDGAAGLWAIKSCGGTTVVQEPADAEHPDMPSNALAATRIDHRVPLAQIAPLLVELSGRPLPEPASAAGAGERIADEIAFAELDADGARDAERLGALSPFTCPSCGGALWEMDDAGLLRYRCHTGHAFSGPSLLDEQTQALEQSLYTALRAVEEKATALRRLAQRWPDRFAQMREDYEQRARELDGSADVLRALLAGDTSNV